MAGGLRWPGAEVLTVMSLSPVARCFLAALVAVAAVGCDRGPEPTACVPEAPMPAASAPAAPAAPAAIAAPSPAAPAASSDVLIGVKSPSRTRAPEAERKERSDVATATTLRVRRLVLSEGVEGREPIGARSTFQGSDLERLYAFVEVENPERLPGEVVVTFESPDGLAVGNVRLDVGAAPRWRTWAFSRAIDRAGEWTAVVRDAEGRVLAREPFSVTS